jgi:hypothetical protein
MTQISIHNIADKMGVKWDGDKDFMSWCQKTVGKKHLDDMSEVELIMIYNRIKNGKYPKSVKEDVFGHRVTTWTPRDTAMLKNKISQPTNDKEKEDFVTMVEPLMKKKSTTAKGLDKELRKFIELDNRISSQDYEQTVDLDDYKKKPETIVFKDKEKKSEEDKNKK